jgi:hypothetical protein
MNDGADADEPCPAQGFLSAIEELSRFAEEMRVRADHFLTEI